MSVKYIVRCNDRIIGTRKSAGHTQPVYTHAVAIWGHGEEAKVKAYCSRPDLARGEKAKYERWGFTAEILAVEGIVTTKKVKPVASWKVEVQADSSGTWAGNAMRYATKDEAETAARDLAWRWTSVREWRVVEG